MDKSSLLLKGLLIALVSLILGFCLGYLANTFVNDNLDRDRKVVEEDESVQPTVDQEDDEPNIPEDNTDESEKTLDLYLFDQALFDTEGSTEFTRAVDRTTTRADVATFLIEQLIIGPTDAEEASGLKDTFGEGNSVTIVDSDESNCDGSDFIVSILDRRATVQFCRDTLLAGDLSGFIVREQIVRTLVQFSTIDEVRVLNKSGECFGDLSGRGDSECYYE